MLTGDNARTTAAIAGSLGLAAKAVLLPASKLAEIGALMAHGGIRQGGRRHQPRANACRCLDRHRHGTLERR